jgi:hypothetical protein
MVIVFCGGWDGIGKTVLLVTFLGQLMSGFERSFLAVS